jgi:hypothetical protein
MFFLTFASLTLANFTDFYFYAEDKGEGQGRARDGRGRNEAEAKYLREREKREGCWNLEISWDVCRTEVRSLYSIDCSLTARRLKDFKVYNALKLPEERISLLFQY